MQKKLRPPCIRGIQAFKKGCPQRAFTDRDPDGCPAWIELSMPTKGGTDSIKISECVDLYKARLQFDSNRLLEGNVQAIESFRNNMSTDRGPRPDPAMVRMVEFIQATARPMIGSD